METIVLSDNYLPVEIDGNVKVNSASFCLKKVENNKKLKGFFTLKLMCNVEIDNVKIESKYFERTFEITESELNEMFPEIVQKAYLEDRFVGVLA